jgi:hypothetical protein
VYSGFAETYGGRRHEESSCLGSCFDLHSVLLRRDIGGPRHLDAGGTNAVGGSHAQAGECAAGRKREQTGEAAFKRLSDVHDVHVLLCPALLSEFNGMKYAYSHTITRQYMLASGAFQIENPDKAADAKATALAAVESVLKTYHAILQQKPDAKAKALDDLLKKQGQGKLKEYVQKQCQ